MNNPTRSTVGSAAAITPIVAVRVLLVLLATAAVVAAVIVSRREEATVARRYVCPMHGEVTASAPGDCPICGMALERTDAAAGAVMPVHADTGDAAHLGLAPFRATTEAAKLLRFSVAKARRNTVRGEVHAPAIAGPDGTVLAQLYRDEAASVTDDEIAEFIPAATPGAPIKVRRDAAPPSVEGAIARVAFRVDPGSPAAGSTQAGQVGWVKLAYKVRAALFVRSAGVVEAPDGPYVLVFSADRTSLSKRHVEIGKDYDGMTAIVSGLTDKDYVVMANTFSFDAQRRLQASP
jgi:multidrug efflux pump subunit AcrA (membrane-fusion protein)